MLENLRSLIFSCKCMKHPFHFDNFDCIDLGEDKWGAEVSLLTCNKCRSVWLKYLIEEPHHTKSGRWWRVKFDYPTAKEFNFNAARQYIEQQHWCFRGGSFFTSDGARKLAPITVT